MLDCSSSLLFLWKFAPFKQCVFTLNDEYAISSCSTLFHHILNAIFVSISKPVLATCRCMFWNTSGDLAKIFLQPAPEPKSDEQRLRSSRLCDNLWPTWCRSSRKTSSEMKKLSRSYFYCKIKKYHSSSNAQMVFHYLLFKKCHILRLYSLMRFHKSRKSVQN